jgi:hypothetical protein
VLISRLPGSAADDFVQAKYKEFLAANFLTTADPGVYVGQSAATNIINARANDNSFPNPAPTSFPSRSKTARSISPAPQRRISRAANT